MVSREAAVSTFKRQLLEEYERTGDIIRCFRIYLGFLKEFAADDYAEFTKWQESAMIMSVYNEKVDTKNEVLETLWNWCRRAGKSRGLTILGVFFSLLDKDVIWRAPHTDQLQQAGKWFRKNPFVKEVSISYKNAVEIYASPEINIGVLSEGKVASRECDILIFDEGGWVFKDKQVYIYYKNSRPMIAASDFKHIIHASTPARYTAFHEEYNSLRKLEKEYDTRFISVRTWEDCPWITEKWIELEREKHSDTPWYIDQNYNVMFVVYGGAVFDNVIEVGDPDYPQFDKGVLDQVIPTHAGVDFNGDPTKHFIVTLNYNDRYVYVLDEIKFLELSKLFDYQNLSLELEDGLFNEQFTDQTKRMGLKCIYNAWNEADKHKRVQELRNRKIVIDKARCPITYKNLMEAAYDQRKRLPRLEKRTDQHGLDALLHGIHEKGGKVYINKQKSKRRKKSFFKQPQASIQI